MKRIVFLITCIFFIASNSFAQFGAEVMGLASIPSGEFSDFYSTAFGGSARLTYYLGSDKHVFIGAGYHQWGFDNAEYNKWFENNGGVGKFEVDAPITAIPLLIGLRYFVGDFNNLKTYIEVSGGYYLIKTELSGQYTDAGSAIEIEKETKNFEELAVGIGVGSLIPLTKKLNADIGFKADFITDSEAVKAAQTEQSKDYYKGKTVTTFLIYLGLTYDF